MRSVKTLVCIIYLLIGITSITATAFLPEKPQQQSAKMEQHVIVIELSRFQVLEKIAANVSVPKQIFQVK